MSFSLEPELFLHFLFHANYKPFSLFHTAFKRPYSRIRINRIVTKQIAHIGTLETLENQIYVVSIALGALNKEK